MPTLRVPLERHGNEAVAKARDMVRNLKERGGNEAAETWLRIIVAIEVLQRGSATRWGTGNGGVGGSTRSPLSRSASVYRNFREAKDFGEFVGQFTADDD